MKDDEKILDYPTGKKEPRPERSRYDWLFQSVMMVSFAVFFIGWLFKLQRWAYAEVILIVSLSVLSFAGLLRYALRPKKATEDYLLMVVYSILPMAFLFQIMHWEGNRSMLIVAGIAFFIYLTVRFAKSFGNK